MLLVRTGKGVATVVLAAPDGQRRLYRAGDPVTGGFRVREIDPGDRKAKRPAKVQLDNGEQRVFLERK